MTNEELEKGFVDAQQQWIDANPATAFSSKQQRYFFWAGSQFGVKVTRAIYDESFNRAKGNLDVAAESHQAGGR